MLAQLRLGRSSALEREVRAFAAAWDLSAGELALATSGRPEPAVLLAKPHSIQGILIASWPTKEALDAFHLLSMASSGRGGPLRVGERVEVVYAGAWSSGVLKSIDASGKAGVQCDMDASGVLTLASLCDVRRPFVAKNVFKVHKAPCLPNTATPNTSLPTALPDSLAQAIGQPSGSGLLRSHPRKLLAVDAAPEELSSGKVSDSTFGISTPWRRGSDTTSRQGFFFGSHRRGRSAM